MRAPQSLVQAAINRLASRLGSSLADTAAGLAVLAQEAPGRLQQEVTLFWQEVEEEADRLERAGTTAAAPPSSGRGSRPVDPQEQIDALRARVADLSRRLDSDATQGWG